MTLIMYTEILLSTTKLGKELEEKLAGASHLIVPVFFAIMGTLVDFKAMGAVLVFGLVITVFAIVGKVLGSGLPAMFSGFNLLGSSRIGIGMLPRGEVALIVAGIGLSAGIISNEIFGVSIMMTVITTLMAPIILVPLFKNPKSGLKNPQQEDIVQMIEPYKTLEHSPHMLSALRDFLVESFVNNGFEVLRSDTVRGIIEIQHVEDNTKLLTIKKENGKLTIDCSNSAVVDVDNTVDAGLTHFEQAVSDLKSA